MLLIENFCPCKEWKPGRNRVRRGFSVFYYRQTKAPVSYRVGTKHASELTARSGTRADAHYCCDPGDSNMLCSLTTWVGFEVVDIQQYR